MFLTKEDIEYIYDNGFNFLNESENKEITKKIIKDELNDIIIMLYDYIAKGNCNEKFEKHIDWIVNNSKELSKLKIDKFDFLLNVLFSLDSRLGERKILMIPIIGEVSSAIMMSFFLGIKSSMEYFECHFLKEKKK